MVPLVKRKPAPGRTLMLTRRGFAGFASCAIALLRPVFRQTKLRHRAPRRTGGRCWDKRAAAIRCPAEGSRSLVWKNRTRQLATLVYGASGQNGRCSPHLLTDRLVLRRPVFAADFFGDFVDAFFETPPFVALLLFLVVLLGVRLGAFAALESVFVALFAGPGRRFPAAFLARFAAVLTAVSTRVPAA
jgi:hypothetical protein